MPGKRVKLGTLWAKCGHRLEPRQCKYAAWISRGNAQAEECGIGPLRGQEDRRAEQFGQARLVRGGACFGASEEELPNRSHCRFQASKPPQEQPELALQTPNKVLKPHDGKR